MFAAHLTRVIYNGEYRVCQYGTYNGTPSHAGRYIASFLKNSNDERMIRQLSQKTSLVQSIERGGFNTGAPYMEGYASISEEMVSLEQQAFNHVYARHPDWNEVHGYAYVHHDISRKLARKFGEQYAQQFLASSDATGFNILDVVYDAKYPVVLYSIPSYLGEPENLPVKAVWEIDYDRHQLDGWWCNGWHTWSFEFLRESLDGTIYSLMNTLERTSWSEYRPLVIDPTFDLSQFIAF